jgi:AraC-like DNA-binding protein
LFIGTWIVEKTIAVAKSLLQNSSIPIKEIAYRLGFAESAHFSNYFRKHTDTSPVAYLRAYHRIPS